ncbi:Glutaredoxin 3 [Coemansia sp. RSA 678]|nr:Glutaredoxin 3 [Coemansia sp. RSA 678]
MSTSKVHMFKDTQSFNDFIEENEFVVVNFYALWKIQSSHMNSKFSQLSEEHPEVKFVQVDIDEMGELSEDYGVSEIPTFKFLRNTSVVDGFSGAQSDTLTKKVEAFSEDAKAAKEPETAD